jgi:hypothetical protein
MPNSVAEGGAAPKLNDPDPLPENVKPKPSASSLSSDLALNPVDHRSIGGLSSLADQDKAEGVEEDEFGRPKLNEPKPEKGRAAEEATEDPSSSSSSGRAISAEGLSGKVGEGVPVSFSSALRRYSSFSFPASAPRPLGSNLSRAPPYVEFGRVTPDGDDGDDGKDGEFTLSEAGRDDNFRLGKEIELERVCE